MGHSSKIKYTNAFKCSAVKLVADSKKSIAQVARDLGIHKDTLRGWVNKTEPVFSSEMDEKCKRLKKSLKIAEQARDILKKARAFAQETR